MSLFLYLLRPFFNSVPLVTLELILVLDSLRDPLLSVLSPPLKVSLDYSTWIGVEFFGFLRVGTIYFRV